MSSNARGTTSSQHDSSGSLPGTREEAREFLARHASEGQNFTLRGILVGLGVGLIICFSNMYFGLQTGWVSSMSMPSSLIGYAFFKTLSKHLDLPFTPVENVLVQTVAGSMGTMPLGCGFVGVMPALNYMLTKEEGGPLVLSTWKLILWALGLCFFGVVFAVPLRKQVIIREKLKFPSGTATALMIGVLHGKDAKNLTILREHEHPNGSDNHDTDDTNGSISNDPIRDMNDETGQRDGSISGKNSWRARVKLLSVSFLISGLYTLATYFIPQLRNLPIFGTALASSWLWTLNPSLAYVGQGIIMGPATTTHMLLGAVIGWGILSPLAKNKGWAPGPVDDWESGSKGWIVWVSLSIMMADAIISLGYIAGQPIYRNGEFWYAEVKGAIIRGDWMAIFNHRPSHEYAQLGSEGADYPMTTFVPHSDTHNYLDSQRSISSSRKQLEEPEPDAPPEHLVSDKTVWIGLILSLLACVSAIRVVFGNLVPLYANVLALPIALILSLMGVRALGETDLNPVSGISKIAQLFFAMIIPTSNKNSVLINLIAGAVSESGALQAGDLMQDLKTGHLLGAAPNAQFWGQIIGSAVGAVVSALIYRLYTSVYEVPGKLFQVPTGYVWVFTARLVTGKGLPPMAWQWALGAAVFFTCTTIIRIIYANRKWQSCIPGGIAVAVGIYNVPSFTLARFVGGLVNWYWLQYRKGEETPIVVLASGLILGEGVVSILNLVLASFSIPHL